MKIFAILIFLFATIIPAQTVDQAMDYSLHSTFIKCYVRHWNGSETTKMPGFENEIKMTCSKFWGVYVEQAKNPETADTKPSPFQLLIPNSDPIPIPFSVWNGYLSATLAICESNPLRKHQ